MVIGNKSLYKWTVFWKTFSKSKSWLSEFQQIERGGYAGERF